MERRGGKVQFTSSNLPPLPPPSHHCKYYSTLEEIQIHIYTNAQMQIHKCMKTQPLPCPCEHYSVHIVNSFTHSHSLACLCTFFLVRLCTLNHYLPCASPQLHLGCPSVIPGTCELFRRCMQLFHQCATLPPI